MTLNIAKALLVLSMCQGVAVAATDVKPQDASAKHRTISIDKLKKLKVVKRDPVTKKWVLDLDKLKQALKKASKKTTPFDGLDVFEDVEDFSGQATGNW